MYIGLVKETICVAREAFFQAPRRWNLVQMAASLRMHKDEFHHHFPFNSGQLTPVKTAPLHSAFSLSLPIYSVVFISSKNSI